MNSDRAEHRRTAIPAADSTKPAKRLRFDRYVLDLDRGSLLLGESEIALRPKTFAVLHFLTQNCGRLVSKDELFAAVWPDLAVTDDTLVQSIGELRRALGTDGPRLIRTVPRRGYRFESHVSQVASIDESAAKPAPVLAVSSEAAPSPVPGGARAPRTFFIAAHIGRRFGWLAALALAIVVAVASLWNGTATDWRSPRNPELGVKPAIAVLPFINESDDAAHGYFADGLAQDVISELGRFSELTVMSWNAVLPYRGKPARPGEIARSLAVRYQVEGSVRQSDDRLRVSAQLVDADGRVLWSGRFDEALADLFALQDKITTRIVEALALRVSQSEQRRVFAKPTDNLEAYDYVLRARPALQRPTRASIAEARALLKRAIRLDPNYAAAYSGLAETYHIDVTMGWAESPNAVLALAEEMADKALSLDDSDVRAHIILGRVHILHNQYEQARVEIDRAIAINPNDALGLAGRGNILMWLGQTDAAISTLEQAQRIDPELNPIDRNALGLAYYQARRYDAAIAQAELNLRKTESAPFSYVTLAAAYAQQNRVEEAAQSAAAIRRTDPTFDPQTFGSKFLNRANLDQLRDGLRKAGLFPTKAGPGSDP